MLEIFRKMRETGRRLRSGGLDSDNALQVGILPTSGWRQRNLDYFGNRVFPSLLSPREGQSFTPDFGSPDVDVIGVTWIGHATFVVQMGGKNILIDPNWANWLGIIKRVRLPGVSLVDLPPIDLVLISHAHHDHLHKRSLNIIANNQPVVVPEGVGKIVRRCGFSDVIEMKYWEQRMVDDLLITFTPAQHWGARYVHDTHRGFGGFIITSATGRSLYHCGDSAYFNGFQQIGEHSSIDLALLPIGAYEAPSGREVHMNPEEALRAFEELGALHMCPMHYGTFPLGREPMHEPVLRLEQGALERGLAERVRVLIEGQPAHF
ncbi:MAG: MBL fold metallo-hydrolase [Verrucomicrobiae bacterium]|nr:MBL fold metallo-hydrolase [Verrucomicrobiae bacterium]